MHCTSTTTSTASVVRVLVQLEVVVNFSFKLTAFKLNQNLNASLRLLLHSSTTSSISCLAQALCGTSRGNKHRTQSRAGDAIRAAMQRQYRHHSVSHAERQDTRQLPDTGAYKGTQVEQAAKSQNILKRITLLTAGARKSGPRRVLCACDDACPPTPDTMIQYQVEPSDRTQSRATADKETAQLWHVLPHLNVLRLAQRTGKAQLQGPPASLLQGSAEPPENGACTFPCLHCVL